MKENFSFNEAQFNRLFPFYFLINRDLKIEATGLSVRKILPADTDVSFDRLFSVRRPHLNQTTFDQILSLENQLVVIELLNSKKLSLRGQFEYLPLSEQLLFVGSPWFNSMEEVKENNLGVRDFAFHDPMIDMLHLLKTQEITNDDLKNLVLTINEQRKQLESANREIHEIALFPTQNPDPLIRINFKGELLRENPAAADLDHFMLKNRTFQQSEFYKLIAETIDLTNTRWIIEAECNGKNYSFVCVPMIADQYINIYGRDITQQRKDRQQLERLSLVASANDNAVLFTTPDGNITWVNEGFTKLTGYTSEEALGKTPFELCKGPLSDKMVIGEMLDLFNNSEGFRKEVIHYRKDKSWFWGYSDVQPLKNSDGQVIEFFGIIQDVTVEKSNKERLRILSQIAENNINAVIITDKFGKITWVNKSFTKMTGYTLEESRGRIPGHFLQGPDTEKTAVDEIRFRIQKGLAFDTEILNYSKSGNKYWVRVKGQAIKDEKGEITGFFSLQEDITKEKESESRFRKALETIGDNAWEHDLISGETRLFKTENEFFDINGDEKNHGQNWRNKILEEDRHLLAEIDKKYRSGEIESHSLEYRIRETDGSHKWLLDRGVVIQKDKDGKPLRTTGIHTDITERKYSEKKLEEQRKFYEEILNNIPADIAVFSPSHKYLFVNPRGIKDPELRKWMIGKRDEDYCHYRNKPFRIAEERRKTFNKVIELKLPSEWEESTVTPEGEKRHMLRRWYPVLDPSNNVSLVIGYGIDITERKRFEEALRNNEEKYRGIITNMKIGLMEIDTAGKIQFANQSMLDLAGLRQDLVHGFDSRHFLPKEYLDQIQSSASGNVRNINQAQELEIKINGKTEWWLVSSADQRSEGGEIIGSIVICLDITNRKKLERELIHASEHAERFAKAKESFLANMSHEIRTPMNAIMGMGNHLAKTDLTEQQNFYLKIINSAAENLLIIIDDILDLSKIEAGELTIKKVPFESKSILANAMQVMMFKAEEKGILLTNSFTDPRLSPYLLGDPYRINQVLLNLLSNAIKFTEKGSVDVSCNVIDDTTNTQTIEVIVSDTGIGMEKAFMDKLFEKFSQEYDPLTRNYSGTGLGMSICKELIELMGGSISVASTKGTGTTVTFQIEFTKTTPPDITNPVTQAVSTDFLTGKTILVADDNEMNRLVASTILQSFGANILETSNGQEAVTVFENNSIDLLLMDIQMPVMNGYEATGLIRKLNGHLPIIAMTANAIKGESEKCLAAGMNDYLAKPFKEKELLKKISYWLNHSFSLKQDSIGERSDITSSPYDLSGLDEISRGNDVFVRKMVKLFCEQSPVIVHQLKEAYEKGDLESMGAHAHKLKPSIDNLRITALKPVIREIEKAGQEKKDSERLKTHLRLTEDVIENTVNQLKEEFSI